MTSSTRTKPVARNPPKTPFLKELWDVKAKLNAEAGYDLDRLIAIVRRDAAAFMAVDGRGTAPAQMPPNANTKTA